MKSSIQQQFLGCALALLVSAGLANAGAAHHSTPHSVTGTAVFYSDKMNGKTLAMKGEKYDATALTAATHSGFPLGSTVKVTNLANQKSVTVKVNDRMNPKSKSVIDLSRKAAEEIDLIHAGHARVRVELAGKP
jgi:rare lipoprotein A